MGALLCFPPIESVATQTILKTASSGNYCLLADAASVWLKNWMMCICMHVCVLQNPRETFRAETITNFGFQVTYSHFNWLVSCYWLYPLYTPIGFESMVIQILRRNNGIVKPQVYSTCRYVKAPWTYVPTYTELHTRVWPCTSAPSMTSSHNQKMKTLWIIEPSLCFGQIFR